MNPDERPWPWLTVQIIAANVVIISLLAIAWYMTFLGHSNVYSDRLMSTFNIEPGQLHAMYVDDVQRQLWMSVAAGLVSAIVASIGLALLIARPIRSLAQSTERLRHGDYTVRAETNRGEVGQLANNFNALALALQQEEGRRARFMADLGHELRTPIMSLQGYTEGLEDGVFTANEQYFKLISSELSQLTTLSHTIESMQLISLDSNDSSAQATVAVSELLENTKHAWATRFEQRGLVLELYIPELLRSAQLNLAPTIQKQIVDNLVSNMFRYASDRAPCVIEVSQQGDMGDLNLVFRNEAPEITEESLPYLFDRFYRVSDCRTRVRNEHPTGLGLSVVRQLCHSNHGSVKAQLRDSNLSIVLNLPVRPDSRSG